ncbi:MAG: creatininase family protein [Crenarchaeota archaeon]|nr:creatininase family protein [Thermoproteota archaeon]
MRLEEITLLDFVPNKLVLLPVGSVEQHGPHLPYTCDTIISQYLCTVAERILKDTVLILPPVYYSCSMEHRDFPGTIYVLPRTFMRYIEDIVMSIIETCSPKAIVIVNGHGGNCEILDLVTRTLNYRNSVKTYHYYVLNERVKRKLRDIVGDIYVEHAGIVETYLIMSISEDLVRFERIVDIVREGSLRLYRTKEISDIGVIGRLSRELDREKSKQVLEIIVNDFLAQLNRILQGPPRT